MESPTFLGGGGVRNYGKNKEINSEIEDYAPPPPLQIKIFIICEFCYVLLVKI